jgi:hypothetical protein
VTNKTIALVLSLFLLLLAAGEVKRAICGPANLNIADKDSQEWVADSSSAFLSAPVLRVARQVKSSSGRVVVVPHYRPARCSAYLPTSQGIPAKFGKDLLTYIEICRT